MPSQYKSIQALSGFAGMFAKNDSDRDWELWAKRSPYFGVLADHKFLNENLTEDSLDEFFLSGQSHVDHTYAVIREKINPDFLPMRVLDYGSGVGRVVIPLAQRSSVAFGVDVSDSMLKIAKENCDKRGITNATMIHARDLSTIPADSIDLIHSSLVFQHIPTGRGEQIFSRLVDLLAKGGIGAIHLNFSDTRDVLHRGISSAKKTLEPVRYVMNFLQGKPFTAPHMQMNNYSMNRMFSILMDSRIENLHIEFCDGPHRSALLYFEKR